MYEINDKTDAGTGGFAGVQENFELEKVSYGNTGKDGKGMAALSFVFRKGEKFVITHNIFPVNEEMVAGFAQKGAGGVELTRAEKIKKAYTDQAAYIKHILTKFMPENEILVKGANFEEYAKNIIKILGNKAAGKKVRIKLVYNAKGFLGLPKFISGGGFIESMDVAKDKSQLKITKWDKITKDEADKEEDSNEYASASAGSSEIDDTQREASAGEDDLPF